MRWFTPLGCAFRKKIYRAPNLTGEIGTRRFDYGRRGRGSLGGAGCGGAFVGADVGGTQVVPFQVLG